MTTQKTLRERVKLARTVLHELDEEWIKAEHGTYLTILGDADGEGWCLLEEVSPRKKLQTVIRDKVCEACAIGSLFVAAIDTYDTLTVQATRHIDGDVPCETMLDYLAPWFTKKELRLIEVAFEGATSGHDANDTLAGCEREVSKAQAFHHRHINKVPNENGFLTSDGEAILRAIMQNVIDNGGVFVP